jgi:hypothetical protein
VFGVALRSPEVVVQERVRTCGALMIGPTIWLRWRICACSVVLLLPMLLMMMLMLMITREMQDG